MKLQTLLLLSFLTVTNSCKKDEEELPPSAYDNAGTYQCVVHRHTDSTSNDPALASPYFYFDSVYAVDVVVVAPDQEHVVVFGDTFMYNYVGAYVTAADALHQSADSFAWAQNVVNIPPRADSLHVLKYERRESTRAGGGSDVSVKTNFSGKRR